MESVTVGVRQTLCHSTSVERIRVSSSTLFCSMPTIPTQKDAVEQPRRAPRSRDATMFGIGDQPVVQRIELAYYSSSWFPSFRFQLE